MRVFNQYLLFLVLTACTINVVMAFFGQSDLSVYFLVNVIAYLIITVLHAYLNPRARRQLGAISVVLFTGFLIMVAYKVIEVI